MNENSKSSPEIEIVVPPVGAEEESSPEDQNDPVEVLSDDENIDSLFLDPEESEGEEIEFADDELIAAEDAPADSARIGELEEELAAMQTERDEVKARMLRIAADLENFRKRTAREKEDMRKYGIDRVVLELLPVLDNLDRAVTHADSSDSGSGLLDGVQMVVRQFLTALEKHGVTGFVAKGELFDPTRHEAIQQVETTEVPNNTVMEEYQKGYFLHDRLIRPSMVSVAKNSTPVEPAKAEAEEEPTEAMSSEFVSEANAADLNSESESVSPDDGEAKIPAEESSVVSEAANDETE